MRRLAPLALALPLLLLAVEAAARVGGGESFGGGGGGGYSGGGSYRGGGGGDGDLGALLLLIELVIRYPAVGVPLVIVLGVVGVFHHYTSTRDHRGVHTTRRDRSAETRVAPGPRALGLDALRRADPAFSLPVFRDFVVLVHRRALEAVTSGGWDPLAPFVAEAARGKLAALHPGVTAIEQVVPAALRIARVDRRGPDLLVTVLIDGARIERRGEAGARQRVEERWTFRRRADARSLAPEAVSRLGCPSCGASIETTRQGACVQCGTAITAGQLQWQLVDADVISRRGFDPPAVSRWAGGDEPGVSLPTVEQRDLAAQLRHLQGMHPDFSVKAFGDRVAGVYLGLQGAWSDNDWKQARPWVTDPMYQTLRFWVEQYTENGLRNELTDVQLLRMRVVRVEVDAWYEAITVRLWGSMKDAVVDRQGKVVGGNRDVARGFSEYWTFLRAVGSGGAVHDATSCPSCGAPLDRVGQAGECGYCGSVITTGRFDWVLSSIEQAEAYDGAG